MTDAQIEKLAFALRDISHGGQSEPLGLEAITMAIGGIGSPGHDSIARGLHDIADAIRELSDKVNDENR